MQAETFGNLLPYPAELHLDAGLWGVQKTRDHNFIFTGVRPTNYHLLTEVASGMYCPSLNEQIRHSVLKTNAFLELTAYKPRLASALLKPLALPHNDDIPGRATIANEITVEISDLACC